MREGDREAVVGVVGCWRLARIQALLKSFRNVLHICSAIAPYYSPCHYVALPPQ